MIEGTVPLVNLVAIVVASWVAIAIHLTSHWWQSQMGRHLLAYLAITAFWYSELLVASLVTGTPATMQMVEAITFLGIGVVTVWRAALMVWYRFRRPRPSRPEPTHRVPGDPRQS